MRAGDIVDVQFAWVKFLLSHPRCGHGMYAGIDITRHAMVMVSGQALY